ncbi:MAG TPA: ABC transporter permease [Acidimicrobiia bacterium]|nr:ABC transporter permease [Acidimicrobiia bacterium]
MSGAATYTRYELLRTLRSTKFFLFSLGFPLILFYIIAGGNRHEKVQGIPLPLYFMTGMAAWGAMMAVVSTGARISGERQTGWNRQLRITPLRVSAYFRAKVLTGYVMALLSILLLYAAGLTLGVHLGPGRWVEMTVLILIGLIPFNVLGILLGHLLSTDAIGPAMGGIVSLFALLGGVWGPLGDSGVMHDISQSLPSYWLVQAGQSALGGDLWPGRGWLVIALWTLVLFRFAARAYRRDTQRQT